MTAYYPLRWFGIIFLGLLIYGQTFPYDFVFDDHLFIVTNPFIKNLNNFHLMWQTFPMTRLVGMYSFAINYYFGQLHPWGYHVFNFIVHLVSTGLVWALAGLLFKITKILPSKDRFIREIPFIIAVLFLVHPCQTQAVTYITQRFESMATMFYLATVYFYLRGRLSARQSARFIFFGLSGVTTLLGIMTKEVVITVPAMVLISEWILFPRKDYKKLHIALLVFGGVLIALFIKMLHAGFPALLQSHISESHDGDVLNPGNYLLTQMRVFLTFLRLLVLPIHQNVEYDYPASSGFLHPPLTIVGLGVILVLIYLVMRLRRQFPLIAFGFAWMLITFSVNLAPRANVIFEHKLYLISFGFFLALVSVLIIWIKNRKTLLKALCCIIAVLSIMSYERNKVWANELILWEDSIQHSPNKARVNANLGRIFGSRGQYDESIKYLSRAIAIHPDNITYENRGVIYSQQGRVAQALDDLDHSIAMDPTYFSTYLKRAWVYQGQHRYKEALLDLAHAIQLDPYFTDAFIERGMIEAELSEFPAALKDFQIALAIEPFNTQAAQYRSYCLAKMGPK